MAKRHVSESELPASAPFRRAKYHRRFDISTFHFCEIKERDTMDHSEGFLKLSEDARSRVREVTVEHARGRLKKGARLIDVREDNEWDSAHAEGASHMGRGVIERDIEKAIPDKDAELILYCGGGYRSALAADNLQRMGYTNVFSMAGGWRAWNDAGAPVVQGTPDNEPATTGSRA